MLSCENQKWILSLFDVKKGFWHRNRVSDSFWQFLTAKRCFWQFLTGFWHRPVKNRFLTSKNQPCNVCNAFPVVASRAILINVYKYTLDIIIIICLWSLPPPPHILHTLFYWTAWYHDSHGRKTAILLKTLNIKSITIHNFE